MRGKRVAATHLSKLRTILGTLANIWQPRVQRSGIGGGRVRLLGQRISAMGRKLTLGCRWKKFSFVDVRNTESVCWNVELLCGLLHQRDNSRKSKQITFLKLV